MGKKLIITDIQASKALDLSEVVTEITWTTSILDQPGKLEFSYINDNVNFFNLGSYISYTIDDNEIFCGTVFSIIRSNDDIIKVTCYDAMIYLQYKDTKYFINATGSQIFASICEENQLKYRVINSSSYALASQIFDNKTYYEMIKKYLEDTLINSLEYYIVRANFDTLEYINIANLQTTIFIGDESLLTEYEYKSSIEDETYNKIKLVQENKETAKREVYITQDGLNIAKWGVLQYFEKVDENMTPNQIKERGNQLLKLYNRKTRSLKCECLGVNGIREGSGVAVGIKDLENEGLGKLQYTFVSECTHTWSGDNHNMSLVLEVV